MNKALILLLVTLVQSQSDGILLSNPNTNDHLQDFQLEGWSEAEFLHPADVSKDYEQNSEYLRKRTVTNDAFTRRSALDKNFMRFGRGNEPLQKSSDFSSADLGKRESKDRFVRFGRAGDNFMRFGKGGTGGGKDGFIRFGRGRSEDFFRAGKSLKENFIRFGKADKNFMRFGRNNFEENQEDFFPSEEFFQRAAKLQRSQENFLRFGKNGKNGTNFLRFGKREPEAEELEESNADGDIRGLVKRKRRDAFEKLPEKQKAKRIETRSLGFFEVPPENFPRRIAASLEGSWQDIDGEKNPRLTPFFPVFSNHLKTPHYFTSEAKRNQGGSNFIRFG